MLQKCPELDEIWPGVRQYIILKGLKFSSKYLQGWGQNQRKFDSFSEVALPPSLLRLSGVLGPFFNPSARGNGASDRLFALKNRQVQGQFWGGL